MTRVALLWHMHQPYYEDLVTREHILPWVRLHALKDYYGMVAMLREFPDVRLTFNLVPSLLVQLEAFAADRARDRHLEIGLKPAAGLDAADIEFALDNFFHAQRQRMIDTNPRYAELLAKRGGSLPTPADRRAAATPPIRAFRGCRRAACACRAVSHGHFRHPTPRCLAVGRFGVRRHRAARRRRRVRVDGNRRADSGQNARRHLFARRRWPH